MYLFGNGHQYCKSPLGNGRHEYVTKYHVIDLELYLLASIHYKKHYKNNICVSLQVTEFKLFPGNDEPQS